MIWVSSAVSQVFAPWRVIASQENAHYIAVDQCHFRFHCHALSMGKGIGCLVKRNRGQSDPWFKPDCNDLAPTVLSCNSLDLEGIKGGFLNYFSRSTPFVIHNYGATCLMAGTQSRADSVSRFAAQAVMSLFRVQRTGAVKITSIGERAPDHLKLAEGRGPHHLKWPFLSFFSFYGPGGVFTCHRPMYLASFAT